MLESCSGGIRQLISVSGKIFSYHRVHLVRDVKESFPFCLCFVSIKINKDTIHFSLINDTTTLFFGNANNVFCEQCRDRSPLKVEQGSRSTLREGHICICGVTFVGLVFCILHSLASCCCCYFGQRPNDSSLWSASNVSSPNHAHFVLPGLSSMAKTQLPVNSRKLLQIFKMLTEYSSLLQKLLLTSFI